MSARPLTDAEAERTQIYADAGLVASRRGLLVAFSYAGGTAAEVAAVRRRDVDADAGTVVFTAGGSRGRCVGRLGRGDGQAVPAQPPPLSRAAICCA